jgi:hypothetical protein
MTAPIALFLEYTHNGECWGIFDEDNKCYGKGDIPEEAIRSARVVTDATIYANRNQGGIIDEVLDVPVDYTQDLTENDTVYSKNELIEALAELGGFEIRRVLGGYGEILGYTMRLVE